MSKYEKKIKKGLKKIRKGWESYADKVLANNVDKIKSVLDSVVSDYDEKKLFISSHELLKSDFRKIIDQEVHSRKKQFNEMLKSFNLVTASGAVITFLISICLGFDGSHTLLQTVIFTTFPVSISAFLTLKTFLSFRKSRKKLNEKLKNTGINLVEYGFPIAELQTNSSRAIALFDDFLYFVDATKVENPQILKIYYHEINNVAITRKSENIKYITKANIEGNTENILFKEKHDTNQPKHLYIVLNNGDIVSLLEPENLTGEDITKLYMMINGRVNKLLNRLNDKNLIEYKGVAAPQINSTDELMQILNLDRKL